MLRSFFLYPSTVDCRLRFVLSPSVMETDQKVSPRSRSHSPVKSRQQPGGDAGLSSSQNAAANPPLPWFTESYVSNEPATAAARKIYIMILASRSAFLIVFLLSVLSIYWGALWSTPTHVHNLNGWIVVSLIPHSSRFVLARCVTLTHTNFSCRLQRYRTLTEGRWASSSRAQWSQVAGRQLPLRGA